MKKHIWVVFVFCTLLVSCGKDEEPIDNFITINEDNLSLQPNVTYELDVFSNHEISYKSENDFYATVTEAGIVTGGRVGTTNILLNNGFDSKKIKVTTYSTNLLYPDPILNFGSTKSTILNILGTPDAESNIGINSGFLYKNSNNSTYGTLYIFSNDKLTLVQTLVKTEYTSLLTSYLNDRYLPAGQVDGIFVYFNALTMSKVTLGVAVELDNTDYWTVSYAPYKSASSSSLKSIIKSLQEKINSLNINFNERAITKNN